MLGRSSLNGLAYFFVYTVQGSKPQGDFLQPDEIKRDAMPKFSISSLMALTFWIAAAIACVSLIKSSDTDQRLVVELITAAFSFTSVGFAFYSLYSSVYGSLALKPFWVGCRHCLLEPGFDRTFRQLWFDVDLQYRGSLLGCRRHIRYR